MNRPRSEGLLSIETAHAHSVTVIGAGAIGSNLVYLLAKLGIGRIVVHDNDVVAEENLEPQFYTIDDIGTEKAWAILETVGAFGIDDVSMDAYPGRWTADSVPTTPIVISGVDSLESRFDIADSLLENEGQWWHYIDMRMGGNVVEMRYVQPGDDLVDYINNELPSIEAMPIPCSMRSVAYNGMVAASLAARAVAAILTGEPVPKYVKVDLLAWSWDVQFT
jgi:molybdopterin/thiamine biosynthesis adenylyltransferase